MFDAITVGNIDEIESLIESESVINIKNSDGYTLLHCVIELKLEHLEKEEESEVYNDIFLLLLEYEANPNIKNNAGATSFALACYHGFEEIVVFMIDNSLVDINLKNAYGLSLATIFVWVNCVNSGSTKNLPFNEFNLLIPYVISYAFIANN